MDAELIIQDGHLKGASFPVKDGADVTIGRNPENDIVLPVQGVSRTHCRLVNQGGRCIITDLGSSNGTCVDGERVQAADIASGSEVTVGPLRLLFRAAEDRTSSKRFQRLSKSRRGNTSVHLVEDDTVDTATIRRQLDPNTSIVEAKAAEAPERLGEQLQAIFNMGNLIYSERDVDRILQIASTAILDVTGADRCSILTVDDETGECLPRAVSYAKDKEESADFPVSRTIVDEAIRTGVSVLSSDASEDDRFKAGMSIVMQNIRSVMCVPLRTEETIIGAIYVDSHSVLKTFGSGELAMLAAIGKQAGVAIERARLVEDLEELFVSAMHSLVATIEAKDAYTRGHSVRVTCYALLIADAFKLDADRRGIMELGGLLHDVGKIGIPEAILNKPGKLDDDEYAVIQQHPVTGAAIVRTLRNIDRIVDMNEIASTVEHHHEHFDGERGYPHGLAGEEIPLLSRILTVADTYDAITSDRPYRKGRDGATALDIIRDCSGTQFDPTVVEAFETVFESGRLEDPFTVKSRFRIDRPNAAPAPARSASE